MSFQWWRPNWHRNMTRFVYQQGSILCRVQQNSAPPATTSGTSQTWILYVWTPPAGWLFSRMLRDNEVPPLRRKAVSESVAAQYDREFAPA